MKESDKGFMKQFVTRILLVLRKYFFRILLVSIVFVIVFCTVSYIFSFRSASVNLGFTYPNASEGLYPNGTFFNAYSIFTDEVIQKGIHNAGLEGFVDLNNIRDEIKIRPRGDASLITTQFIVSYSAGAEDKLGAITAEGLLKCIVYAYIEHFHDTYSNDQVVLKLNIEDTTISEYIDDVKYINMGLNQMHKYLSVQQGENEDFASNDGTSFQDLLNIIDQYRSTSLHEIRAIITERGVTKDRDVYLERLNYRKWNSSNSYDYNRKIQQLYKNILQEYEARLTSVVFIPSLDSERKFYMSKTKIGIDIFSLNATDYEEQAEEIQRQMNEIDEYISKIEEAENISQISDNTDRVEKKISELKAHLKETMKRILLMEKEYSQYKNHNYVTVSPVEISFMERTRAKYAVAFMVLFDVILVLFLSGRKGKKKGNETK